MRGVFDDERAEPQQGRRDTELTLSSTTLFGILFGLLLLCGLCFGVGYALGHRGAAETAAAVQPDATTPATLQSDGSRPKPSAGPASAAQPASNDVADPAASADTAANSADRLLIQRRGKLRFERPCRREQTRPSPRSRKLCGQRLDQARLGRAR